ncbi:hypothetical protein JDV02_002376 [Purpureocillium takamizusanense]|uniref:F-box domain protein n=1 Tax=Purpureocillium takamizusanense TaxID=2060973 RepID=A0A9Q8V7D6_9HYPO|nr:uncharacterized protein JDV02_002376 [Purpureocillium takamizusanense]UNI15890.1 hypothetical protein JDV02_002376 [Purpureocillium takamizusanense]
MRVTSLKEAGLFPNLRRVTFETLFSQTLSLESAAVLLLLSMAPSLTHLRFRQAVGNANDYPDSDGTVEFQPPILWNLRVLELASSAFMKSEWLHLIKLIAHCPSLESFHFDANGYDDDVGSRRQAHLPPRHFLVALKFVRKTLRHLHLCFANAAFASDETQTIGAELLAFENLETLELDVASFTSPRGDPLEDDATCLSRILPASIRRLRLIMLSTKRSQVQSQILDLAKAAGAGRFASLRRVELHVPWRDTSGPDDEGFIERTGWKMEQLVDARNELAKAGITLTCITALPAFGLW